MDRNTKLLGGWGYVGAIVFGILGGFMGPVGGILALAGAIVVLVAYFRAANEFNRPEIRSNAVIALVLAIAAAVIFAVLVGASVAALLLHRGEDGAAGLTGGMIAGGLIAWVLGIAASWFWYKASTSLADASGQNLFKTGGLLMFIGSITVIVFGIGGIVSLVGEIMQTIGFFGTDEKTADRPPAPGAAA